MSLTLLSAYPASREPITGFPTYQTVNSLINFLDRNVRNYEWSHALCGLTFRYLAVVVTIHFLQWHPHLLCVQRSKMELTALRELLKKHRLTDKDINRQVNVNNLERISHFCYKQWKSLPSHLRVQSNVIGEIDKTHKDEKTKCLNFLLWWSATYKQLLTALLSIKCEQAAEMLCTRLKESASDSLQPQLPTAGSPISGGTSDDEPPRSKTGNFRLQLVAWVSWRDTIHGRSRWNFHTQGFS